MRIFAKVNKKFDNKDMTANTHITVNLTPASWLEQVLFSEKGVKDPTTIKRLTITGVINDISFVYIREKMAKTLQVLDMGGATVEDNTIPDRAFELCTGLTSITMPNSIKTIGDFAFCDCTGLTAITIPNSVTKIGSRAFLACSGLTSVNIPNSVTLIGSFAFFKCVGLKSVVIPNSVTEIGASAFFQCSGLTSVDIPNSVTKIGEMAFNGCTNLTSISISASVAEIGRNAFWGQIGWIVNNEYSSWSSLLNITVHSDNNVFTSIDNVLFDVDDKYLLMAYPNGRHGDYIIPDFVEKIGDNAFVGCIGLTSVTIPNSVREIGLRAFVGCSGLSSIFIPASVHTIDETAFDDCAAFITVDPKNTTYTSENGVLKRIQLRKKKE